DRWIKGGIKSPQRWIDRGLIELHLPRRILGLYLVQLGLHRTRYAHVGCALGFEDSETGRRPAIEPGERAHLRDAVAHVGDLAQAERAPAAGDDLGLRQILCALGAAQHPDRLLAAAHLGP